ncbi:MAG: D-Ala-D-Ala carboxypeptidase family metallohydrolase [Pseudomonadota bacterium]|nr:D-Ala-D-Ala carboxypeptidase family metallohydrolase [Pseudomonadota bacterium]
MMHRSLALLALLSAPAAAQNFPVAGPSAPPVMVMPQFANPAAAYVTVGQDEPGYRSWYLASPRHAHAVNSFNSYLTQYEVGGVLPTWQLLRTASSWRRCGQQPYEVPPVSEWPNVVQTLRYVRDYVIPSVGPVEAVSAYRNPILNVCAGGAPESAHKHYSAIDMVPLRPTSREELIRTLCRVHAERGTDYSVGLGFYAYLRFHVDTTKYRRWGADPASAKCPPIIKPEDVASVAQPLPVQPVQPTPSPTLPMTPPTTPPLTQ